jgi:hypothetical protein
MDLHRLGLPLGLPLPAAVAELAHQFLGPPVDVPELGIPVGMITPLDRLPVGLEAVSDVVQESVDRPLTDLMPPGREFLGQLRRALARPP